MDYSINDLLSGANVESPIVCTPVSDRRYLRFNHEEDGHWYVNFPGWPFSHHNLMMVAGADELCAFLSDDDRFAHIEVIPSRKPLDKPGYACLERGHYSMMGGSYYKVTKLPGFEREIWLCPVTLFVLGRYPKYIYIKKSSPLGSGPWGGTIE